MRHNGPFSAELKGRPARQLRSEITRSFSDRMRSDTVCLLELLNQEFSKKPMNLWHDSAETLARSVFENDHWWLDLVIGTWPVAAGQSARATYRVERSGHVLHSGSFDASWSHNRDENSYWRLRLGPFEAGEEVDYSIEGESPRGRIVVGPFKKRVGPRLFLALVWHQHQPFYQDGHAPDAPLVMPSVRLHAIRDYYSMAAMIAAYPNVHLTINLTPVLLQQIGDYIERGRTDRALALTLTPTSALSRQEVEEICTTFFDADWHNEIYPHPRYKELLEKRAHGRALSDGEITDLRMWFNLAWFAPEFQNGAVEMPDGSSVSVRRFLEKGEGFTETEIAEMVGEQFKILRNVIAIHRQFQDRGQIEVSTTPFYHPILPLLHDSDQAILDRNGTTLPARFCFPEDANAQVASAIDFYRKAFGRAPRGMWPAEGAVGESIIPHFTQHGVRWIASDAGVLQRSGEWGYEAERPDLLAQAWRAGHEEPEQCVTILFRDTDLSNAIGFHYGQRDAEEAASDFVSRLKARFQSADGEDRIVSVILDGENAWGSYRQAGRPFFEALYRKLGGDPEICTVTPNEYIEGNPERGVPAHPVWKQPRVHRLAHASWIDESASRPGNDLGTWIGEREENAAWDLLRATREAVRDAGATPQSHASAFESLYAAEGSDWFWWYGDDQNCDAEPIFDELFRGHLHRAYEQAGLTPPAELEAPLVPRVVTWTFIDQKPRIHRSDRLRIKTGCSGTLFWSVNGSNLFREIALAPSGGVMAGLNVYTGTLPPFNNSIRSVEFWFRCGCSERCRCKAEDLCCEERLFRVAIGNAGRTPQAQDSEVASNANQHTLAAKAGACVLDEKTELRPMGDCSEKNYRAISGGKDWPKYALFFPKEDERKQCGGLNGR